MKETAVWKGRLVDLEFHLELHLEQTWGPLPDKVSPNKLKFLAPNLVDTGRFQISWYHPFYLEIFDKDLQQKMIFTATIDAQVGSFSKVNFSLLDGTKILWPSSDLPVAARHLSTRDKTKSHIFCAPVIIQPPDDRGFLHDWRSGG